jgi:hypothetical protein
LILVVMVAGIVKLILGSGRSAKKASSKLPPTPEMDPLAQPKSLQQVTAPAEMTRAAIPANNPQTPEKISFDHYNKGDGLQNPYLDEDIQPLALTESDIDDLLAFMVSLTSANYKQQGAAELVRQRALCRTNRPQRDTARAFGPKPPQPAPPK